MIAHGANPMEIMHTSNSSLELKTARGNISNSVPHQRMHTQSDKGAISSTVRKLNNLEHRQVQKVGANEASSRIGTHTNLSKVEQMRLGIYQRKMKEFKDSKE